MPNIYLKRKKLKPSQIENLRNNVSFIITELGIHIKSLAKGKPITTNLKTTVYGPFSYRTAFKFLNYSPEMEISLNSCTALIQFYNRFFEPEIHGDIVVFSSHNLAAENAHLKAQYRQTESDDFSRKCIDFFSGNYYLYYPSSINSEMIGGGIVQIYEYNSQLRMKLISRLNSDEELDLVKEVISGKKFAPEDGMKNFLQHELIRKNGVVFYYHDGLIDMNEKKGTFTVAFTDIQTSNQVMLLSLHNAMISLQSVVYEKYVAGMGFCVFLSGDGSKMFARKFCLSKYKFSLKEEQDLLNQFFSVNHGKNGIPVISTEEVTDWLREVSKKQNEEKTVHSHEF